MRKSERKLGEVPLSTIYWVPGPPTFKREGTSLYVTIFRAPKELLADLSHCAGLMLKCALSDGVYCFSRYGEKREMGAKPGSVLPTVASKTGILYAPMVERCKTQPFQG